MPSECILSSAISVHGKIAGTLLHQLGSVSHLSSVQCWWFSGTLHQSLTLCNCCFTSVHTWCWWIVYHWKDTQVYWFNEEVWEKILSVANSFNSTPPAVERAKESLRKGQCLLVARQKAIRIVDRSEYSWATVDEYEKDELGETRMMRTVYIKSRHELVTNLRLQQPRIERKKDFLWRKGGPRPSCRLAALLPGVGSHRQAAAF